MKNIQEKNSMENEIDINKVIKIAQEAGAAIMQIYAQDIQVEYKDDNSPLTLADKASNDVIVKALSEYYPSIPIISEENKLIPYEERKDWHLYWLVDPLDGTKEFIKRNGEFTVNIALISSGMPVAGVIYVPVNDITYYSQKGRGSFKTIGNNQPIPIHISSYKEGDALKIVGSRSHSTPEMDNYVSKLKEKHSAVEFVAAGSSLKFCLVAEGVAHEYPRLGPTMEWDTAAGQAIAEEAGAYVIEAERLKPLRYNKENLLNPYFLVTNPQVR